MPDLPSPSDVELAAWQALCEKATPPPWVGGVLGPLRGQHDMGLTDGDAFINVDDAAFIAAARDALPRLLAEVRRLREELADADAWPEIKARRAAVAAEREACAQVVEQYAEVHPARCVAGENCCREHLLIAAAIRARGQPPA